MRWAALVGFCAFAGDGADAPLTLAMFRGFKVEVAMESDLLRAAGSISGMVEVEMGGLESFPQRDAPR